MKRLLGIQADIWGITASFACALHCSLIPILLALSSFSALAWMQEEWVEIFFLVTAFAFSIWSILPSFLKDRGQLKSLLFMMIGLFLLIIGYATHMHDGSINGFSVLGGIALCYAHWINFRYQQEVSSLSAF